MYIYIRVLVRVSEFFSYLVKVLSSFKKKKRNVRRSRKKYLRLCDLVVVACSRAFPKRKKIVGHRHILCLWPCS